MPRGFQPGKLDRVALPGPVDQQRFLGLDLRPGGLAALKGLLQANGGFLGTAAYFDKPTQVLWSGSVE